MLHNVLFNTTLFFNRIFLYCFLLLLVLLLAACEEAATPYPVEIPATPTDPPLPTEAPPLRVALSANTIDRINETDAEVIMASGQVEQLSDEGNLSELGIRYDLVMGYGEITGWVRSPITPRILLVINPNSEQLSSASSDLIFRAINPSAAAATTHIPGSVAIREHAASPPETIREELANRGQPDGLQLTMGYAQIPGASTIIEQLNAANIETYSLPLSNAELRDTLTSGRIQLALVIWTTPEEQQQWQSLFGTENTLDLYTLPISYLALPELTLSFTPGGWPVASR